MQEMWVLSLGEEGPLEKEMVTHSSILAWETPWTKELGGLQSMGSQSRTQLSDWTTTTNNNIWIMTLLGTLEIFHILKQFTWEYSGRVRIFVKCEKANFISKSKDEKGNHHNTSWSILERIQLQVGSLKMSRSVSQVTELVCPSENMCTQFETCCPLHKVLLLFVLCFISILDTGIIPVNCKPLSRTYGNSQSVDKPTVSLTQNDELSQSEALFWMDLNWWHKESHAVRREQDVRSPRKRGARGQNLSHVGPQPRRNHMRQERRNGRSLLLLGLWVPGFSELLNLSLSIVKMTILALYCCVTNHPKTSYSKSFILLVNLQFGQSLAGTIHLCSMTPGGLPGMTGSPDHRASTQIQVIHSDWATLSIPQVAYWRKGGHHHSEQVSGVTSLPESCIPHTFFSKVNMELSTVWKM